VIEALKEAYSVNLVCRALEIPRSSYYAAKRAQGRVRLDAAQVAQVQRIHVASRRSYGSRRMARELTSLGQPVGRHRARTLMKQAGVWNDRKRRHRHTPPGPASSIAPNHLARQFNPPAPNRVWAGHVTCLPTRQGWVYLAIVMDLYARRIVGAAFSTQANTSLVMQALEQAWRERQPGPGVLFHSDQGSTYTSATFVTALERYGMVQA